MDGCVLLLAGMAQRLARRADDREGNLKYGTTRTYRGGQLSVR